MIDAVLIDNRAAQIISIFLVDNSVVGDIVVSDIHVFTILSSHCASCFRQAHKPKNGKIIRQNELTSYHQNILYNDYFQPRDDG
mmetsp:Transcript_10854/g.23221  ORF Transcript_10854/g.23221 Transcript_10854/m.23221 type:complete len:84 (+) Transcript_10854:152-403(+)